MGKRNENSDLKKIKLETGTVYQTVILRSKERF